MLSVHMKATRPIVRRLEAEIEDDVAITMADIGHLQITNTADHPDSPEYGNYKYTIQMDERTIRRGRVENHLRSQGAWSLVQKVLFAALYPQIVERAELGGHALGSSSWPSGNTGIGGKVLAPPEENGG